ncbi:MAG: hypothetical protein RIA69_20580 [Cyclobacteriaceae bacterium]
MKKLLYVVLIFVFGFLSEAQVSPIFQVHPMKFDLPAFNPAFAGDSESSGLRLISNFGILRPTVSDKMDYNTYLGIDTKIPLNSGATSFITTGGTFNFNSYSIEGDLGTLAQPENQFRYEYGFAEVYLGLRLPTRFSRKTLKKRGAKKSIDADLRTFKKLKTPAERLIQQLDQPQSPVKPYDTYANLNKAAMCSWESVSDFIAFNMLFGTDIMQVRGINTGAVFGDQIMFNTLGSTAGPSFNPYSMAGSSRDPMAQINVTNENTPYLGVGILYHLVLYRQYVIRMGATMKSLLRNYTGLPDSNQVSSPLKILQISGYSAIGLKNNMGFHMMYIDQNPEYYPEFSGPVNQWRFGANYGFKTRGVVSRAEMGESVAYESTDLGFALNILKDNSYIISPFFGCKIRTNTNFSSSHKNKLGNKKYNEKNFSGSIFTVTFNYDMYLGNLSQKDLGGTYRLGIVWQQWRSVR